MNSLRNYLKLQVYDFQIKSDVNFGHLISKQQSLVLVVNIDYYENGKIIQDLSFSDFINKENQYFYEKNSQWESIEVSKGDASEKNQLVIQILLVKRQKIDINKVYDLIAKIFTVKQQNQDQTYEQEPTCKRVDVLFKSRQQKIPLDKFFKFQNINHDITLDVFPHAQSKWLQKKISQNIVQSKKQVNLKQQQIKKLLQKKVKQRIGTLNFRLTYLPNILYQIQFKRFSLDTQCFSKDYKLSIKQSITERNPFQDNKSKVSEQDFNQRMNDFDIGEIDQNIEILENKEITDRIQKLKADISNKKLFDKEHSLDIAFTMQGWNKFQNKESFKTPLYLPMKLQNNKDAVQFVFEFFQKTQSLILNKVQTKRTQQKSKKNKNDQRRNSKNQISATKLNGGVEQAKKSYNVKLITLSKMIPVSKISKLKGTNKNRDRLPIVFRHKSHQFTFNFDYKLVMQAQSLIQKSKQV